MSRSGDTIRVAVLGASAFAEAAHIPGVNAHPGGEVVALYGRDLERTKNVAARAGVAEATDDLDALLARTDIDAVTVASSDDRHCPYAMAALRAGKHVFCEKPMALDPAQAAEMTLEAQRRGVVHQVSFIFRYTSCFQELRRRVVEGAIGTPHYVEVQGAWFSKQLAGPGALTWRDDAALHGAGQLGEMGSHFIDAVNFLCGPASGFISEVAAATFTLPRASATLDLASFLLRTERGLQGHVLASRATPAPALYDVTHGHPGQRGDMGYVTVTGERGALMATFTRGETESLRRMRPGGAWEAVGLPPGAEDGQPHGIVRMLGSFIDSVGRGHADPDLDATFEDGFRAQAAIDAVVTASHSRRWEPVAIRPG